MFTDTLVRRDTRNYIVNELLVFAIIFFYMSLLETFDFLLFNVERNAYFGFLVIVNKTAHIHSGKNPGYHSLVFNIHENLLGVAFFKKLGYTIVYALNLISKKLK